MISINATLLIQVIHFLVLVFILNRLMFRPILKLIKDRSYHIEKTKTEINNIDQEIERLRDEYLSRESDARKDAIAIRGQIKNEGSTKAQSLFDESRKEMASIRAETEEEVDKEIQHTKPLLGDEAAALVDEIMVKVIGRRIAA